MSRTNWRDDDEYQGDPESEIADRMADADVDVNYQEDRAVRERDPNIRED